MARRFGPARKEKDEVADVLDYLDLLYRLGTKIHYWVNEENPGIRGRSHKRRGTAPDIIGIIAPHGRWLAIEMKKPKIYKYIMENYASLRDEQQNNDTYLHYQKQIHVVERINQMGGLAFFAGEWRDVRDKLKAEGVDKTSAIIAGDPSR